MHRRNPAALVRSSAMLGAFALVATGLTGLSAAPAGAVPIQPCAAQSFTQSGSCTVEPGTSVIFTIKAGNGGAGGAGGAGGQGGTSTYMDMFSMQTVTAFGGSGGPGGAGGAGGAGAKITGTYMNSTATSVTLDIVIGTDGSVGSDGSPGSVGTPNSPGLAGTGGTGTTGNAGNPGQASTVAVSGGALIASAGGGLGGQGGLGGTGGTGGNAAVGPTGTPGSPGSAGAAGANGANGQSSSLPSPLPGTWTFETTTSSESPSASFQAGPTAPDPAPPAPPTPPGSPTDVLVAADGDIARVTWKAPDSTGDYPITHYQVQSIPGSKTCLASAPALTCDISGLVIGATYTFEVRALSGAGWGTWSAASAPVTLVRPTITITGTRTSAAQVRIEGLTTGMNGQVVTAQVRLSGQARYSVGSQSPVDPAGTFTWQRKTSKSVQVYFESNAVRSNVVRIAGA